MKKKQCEFKYKGQRCLWKDGIGEGVNKIARCKNLCSAHIKTVQADNIRRFNKGQDIPIELIFTKKLLLSETWSDPRTRGITQRTERRD